MGYAKGWLAGMQKNINVSPEGSQPGGLTIATDN